jgi:hypothetical protein
LCPSGPHLPELGAELSMTNKTGESPPKPSEQDGEDAEPAGTVLTTTAPSMAATTGCEGHSNPEGGGFREEVAFGLDLEGRRPLLQGLG